MRFTDVTGHNRIKEELRHLVDSDRIPHALMLSGVSGVGKMNMARAFAQYIHCSSRRDGEPCGVCPSCVQHKNLNHPDMHYVYPLAKAKALSEDYTEQWRKMLGEYPFMPWEKWLEIIEAGNSQPAIHVEESAAIISRASMSAYREKYKIFLIWLPEKMRPEAANKLLKIIEEPFEDTIFILVSNDEKGVLPTIFSRTRRLQMKTVDEATVSDFIMRIGGGGMTREYADQLARLAEGIPGKAFELASYSGETIEFRDTFQEMMRLAYARNFVNLRQLSDRLAALGREKLQRYLAYCSRMIRENFIYNIRCPQLTVMTPDEEKFSGRFSPFVNHANVERISTEIDRTRIDISRNGNAKIVMFDFLLYLSALIRLK